jgi:hypothetical protein
MSCHRSQAACLLMCSMAPISDQLSSRALVRWHSHQLGGAVGKTADEVDVSERLQGLVPVVGVPGTAVGLSLCRPLRRFHASRLSGQGALPPLTTSR